MIWNLFVKFDVNRVNQLYNISCFFFSSVLNSYASITQTRNYTAFSWITCLRWSRWARETGDDYQNADSGFCKFAYSYPKNPPLPIYTAGYRGKALCVAQEHTLARLKLSISGTLARRINHKDTAFIDWKAMPFSLRDSCTVSRLPSVNYHTSQLVCLLPPVGWES